MYKFASDSRQRALHRGRPSDWIGGEERLSAADQLALLRQSVKMLEDRIKLEPLGSENRRTMGLEKLAVQEQIKVLKDGLPKAPPDWKMHFVNEAKRILSDSQFRMVENAAKIEAQREQSRREAEQGASANGSA